MHYTELNQAILYQGAGLDLVSKPFTHLLAIGAVLFSLSLTRCRKANGEWSKFGGAQCSYPLFLWISMGRAQNE